MKLRGYLTVAVAGGALILLDPIQRTVIAGLARLRARRDGAAVARALAELKTACGGTENLLPRILACVEAHATVGEICRAMEEVFGAYREAL